MLFQIVPAEPNPWTKTKAGLLMSLVYRCELTGIFSICTFLSRLDVPCTPPSKLHQVQSLQQELR